MLDAVEQRCPALDTQPMTPPVSPALPRPAPRCEPQKGLPFLVPARLGELRWAGRTDRPVTSPPLPTKLTPLLIESLGA